VGLHTILPGELAVVVLDAAVWDRRCGVEARILERLPAGSACLYVSWALDEAAHTYALVVCPGGTLGWVLLARLGELP